MAKAKRPSDFCNKYRWPKFRNYATRKYDGNANVRMLAHEFCHRSRFYYNIWADSGFADAFPFHLLDSPRYADSQEFLDWAVGLPVAGQAFAAVVRDRAVVPA